MDIRLLQKFLEETKLLRQPKKTLSTFGATRIEYYLVSPVEDLPNRTRLRNGLVVSERPKILTPEALQERFQGFGEEAQEFAEWLKSQYKDLLRILEYRFRNQDFKTQVLSQNLGDAVSRITGDMDARDIAGAAVIQCPDGAWSLALMKFALDEAARSFPVNVRDYETHGLFDPGSNQRRKRLHEIESLFKLAKTDAAARAQLSQKLKEYGIFSEYEDRFLGLYR